MAFDVALLISNQIPEGRHGCLYYLWDIRNSIWVEREKNQKINHYYGLTLQKP